MEGAPDQRKRRLSRGGVESGLGGSLARGTRARVQKIASGTFSRARTKVRETDGKREWRQERQRFDRHLAPWEDNAHARDQRRRRKRHETLHLVETRVRYGPPKRPGRRDTSGPRSCCAEPETLRSVHAVKVASGVGSARGAGAAESFRWQKSVGRVVRFGRR